jgi:hypothetical protein
MTELADPPPAFRRWLNAMRLEMAELCAAEAEDGAMIPFLGPLVDSLSNLQALSVVDTDGILPPGEIQQLCALAVSRLTHCSIDIDELQPAQLHPLLQPASAVPATLRQLRLSTDLKTDAMPLVLQSMEQSSLTAANYRWPLAPSLTGQTRFHWPSACNMQKGVCARIAMLTASMLCHSAFAALTVSVADTRVLRALSLLQHLTALDLDVHIVPRTPEALQRYEDAWGCLHSGAYGVPDSSEWVFSMRTLHVSAQYVCDALVLAASRLTSLQDFALLDMGTDEEDDVTCALSMRVEEAATSADALADSFAPLTLCDARLTPAALLQLRRLTQLTKLELNVQSSWLLALVPFVVPAAAADISSDDPSPLLFWSSFPQLFQLKLHPHSLDSRCLPSLSTIDWPSLLRAVRSVTGSEPNVHPQDVLLYALGSSSSLRSLHINPLNCQPSALRAFSSRIILDHIPQPPAIHPLCGSIKAPRLASSSSSSSSAARDVVQLPIFDLAFFWLPGGRDADGVAEAVTTFASTLRYLHFITFTQLHDEGLMHVLRTCTSLHTLDIRGCTQLTPASLRQIGICIPGLHSLNLSYLSAASDEVVREIVQHTPSLHSLHLESTSSTTSKGLLPLLATKLHLLCLNVLANDADRWDRQALMEYKNSRDYAIQLISDFGSSGEK